MHDWEGKRVQHRRTKRLGIVVGDSGGLDVRVRYDDGKRDAWVQRTSLYGVAEGTGQPTNHEIRRQEQ